MPPGRCHLVSKPRRPVFKAIAVCWDRRTCLCEGWWQGQALPFLIPQRVTWPSGVLAGRPHRLKGLVPSSFCPHTDLMGPIPGHGIGFVTGGLSSTRRQAAAEVAVRKSLSALLPGGPPEAPRCGL